MTKKAKIDLKLSVDVEIDEGSKDLFSTLAEKATVVAAGDMPDHIRNMILEDDDLPDFVKEAVRKATSKSDEESRDDD